MRLVERLELEPYQTLWNDSRGPAVDTGVDRVLWTGRVYLSPVEVGEAAGVLGYVSREVAAEKDARIVELEARVADLEALVAADDVVRADLLESVAVRAAALTAEQVRATAAVSNVTPKAAKLKVQA